MLGVQGFRRDEPLVLTHRVLSIVEAVTPTITVVATSATRKTVTISTSALGYFVLFVWAAPASGDLTAGLDLLSSPVLPAYRVTDAAGVLEFDLVESQAGAWRICAVVVNRATMDGEGWEGLTAVERPEVPDGTLVVYGGAQWSRRFAGTQALEIGTTETTVDLTALGLTSTSFGAQVSMQIPDDGVLLYPVVTSRSLTTLGVAWGSEIPAAGYVLHWDIKT